jgi:hypothetical protein
MTKTLRWLGLLAGFAGAAVLGTAQISYASDHDDGETELKSRSLNLTDHFAFKDANGNLVLTMYLNPRSMPHIQYFLNTLAHYEFHISKAASDSATPTPSATGADDYVFQFAAAAPDDTGAQAITLNLLEGGTAMGSAAGVSTTFANSQAGTTTNNTGTVGGIPVTFFVGMRADAFTFDVIRFFQVRAFLAGVFFGGANGAPDPSLLGSLEPTCDGHTLLDGHASTSNGDIVHLFNPPVCAPDFTKNYNVIAIVLSIPISSLGGGSIFDTWSIITVQQ